MASSLITHNDAPQSVGLLWTSDQLVAETSAWQHNTKMKEASMPPAGFEPTISAGEWPQTCAATGTGVSAIYLFLIATLSPERKYKTLSTVRNIDRQNLQCHACKKDNVTHGLDWEQNTVLYAHTISGHNHYFKDDTTNLQEKMLTYIQKLVHVLVNLAIVKYTTQCTGFNNVKPRLLNIPGWIQYSPWRWHKLAETCAGK